MNEFKESIKSALNEYFEGLLKCLNGLTEPELYWQPSLESNHMTWLVWHMARVEDRWINSIVAGKETVWDKNNWNEQFGVDQEDYGKGYNKEDISKMENQLKNSNFLYSDNIPSFNLVNTSSILIYIN